MFTYTHVLRVAVLSLGLIFLSSSPINSFAAGDSVDLEWAPNSESDLEGYNVYHGTNSGVYGFPDTVRNSTSHHKGNLDPSKRHHFAVTAFDDSGNESAPSAEVSTPPPSVSEPSAPAPPASPPPPPAPPAPASEVTSLTAAHSQKCLEIPGSSQSTGAGATQSNCTGAVNQQFQLKSVGPDTFQLIANHSGQCLEIAGGSTADEARVQQNASTTGTHQRFRVQVPRPVTTALSCDRVVALRTARDFQALLTRRRRQ